MLEPRLSVGTLQKLRASPFNKQLCQEKTDSQLGEGGGEGEIEKGEGQK